MGGWGRQPRLFRSHRRHPEIRCLTCAIGGGANRGRRSGARPDVVGPFTVPRPGSAPGPGPTGGFLVSQSCELSSWLPVARHMTGGGGGGTFLPRPQALTRRFHSPFVSCTAAQVFSRRAPGLVPSPRLPCHSPRSSDSAATRSCRN